ncbi:MAG: hypothetical protein R6V11_09045 [Ectothiorhodospiraceae bacterium]
MNTQDRPASRDPWLRLLLRISLPMAAISLIALWAGWLAGLPALFYLFLVTGGITLVTGFAYNIRYVLLATRQGRQDSE